MAKAKAEEREESRLLGAEAEAGFRDFLARSYWAEIDFREAVARWLPNRQVRKEANRRWKAVAANGGDPGTDPVLLDELKDIFVENWWDHVQQSQDGLTKAAILSAPSVSWYKHYLGQNPDLWTSWIRPGSDGYVVGRKRTGKTDLATHIGHLLIQRGGTVVSTIALTEETEGYLYCSRASDLLRTSCALSLQGVTCLVLIDEGFIHASGESPLDPKVRSQRQFLRLFGKLGIASLYISQFLSDILRDVRRVAAFRAQKLSLAHRDHVHVQVEGEIDGVPIPFSDSVKGWPPTSLPFRTENISTFVMDFEPTRLMEYLSSLEMTDNQFEAVLGWLDERGLHLTREVKVWLARRLHATRKLSQGEIGQILGVGSSTVSRWIRGPP